jgi:uncharacterized protein
MLNEASILSELPIHNIKFHQLQIAKNTPMAIEYEENSSSFSLFSLEDYTDFIIEFIENLNPDFIIERFSGEMPPGFIIGPDWGLIRNDGINLIIERKLAYLDSWQGKKYNPN